MTVNYRRLAIAARPARLVYRVKAAQPRDSGLNNPVRVRPLLNVDVLVGKDATVRVSEQLTFDDWYRAAWPRLVRTLAAATGSVADAEDLASLACGRAMERWGTIDDPSAWVIRVALNHQRRVAVRVRQRVRFLPRGESTTEMPDVDPELWAAVRGLPRRQCEVIALRYVADLTQREIAAVTGLTPGTVAATLHQARANLEQRLKHDRREVR